MSPRSERTSLYIGPAMRELLDSHPDGKGFWTRSGLLNTVASRYAEVVRRSMPTLSLAEWLACMDALNGCWLMSMSDNEAGLITSVWAEVYDADRLGGLGRKWKCDAKALAERIRDWEYPKVVALVDAVERWWAANSGKWTEHRESVVAIVGKEHVTD